MLSKHPHNYHNTHKTVKTPIHYKTHTYTQSHITKHVKIITVQDTHQIK